MEIITEELVKKVIKKRTPLSHKGDYGKILLVGGSEQYGGAICLSAMGCLYSGAGLITVACAESVRQNIRQLTPEVMTLNYEDEATLEKLIPTFNVIILGSGLGLEQTGRKVFHFVLNHRRKEQFLIIDGSGITLFAEEKLSVSAPEKIIFTPHQKEWERLSGLEIAQQTTENNQEAQKKLQSICVVKSHETTIYSSAEALKNTIGTPAQATGGMGDVLGGMVGGFLGQFAKNNSSCAEIIAAAVFCHSYGAKVLAEKQYVTLPSQIAKLLPEIMKYFSQN